MFAHYLTQNPVIFSILKNTDIEDVNNALKELQKTLDNKSNKTDFNGMVNEQALINEFLCTENIIARWKWKSGSLRSGSLIPWEVQSINTLPDNFIWEKNESAVVVITAGLYEVSFGLYSKKKPACQLLVNGEVIISAVNSSSYVIHHSSGKLADIKGGKTSNTNVTGTYYFLIILKRFDYGGLFDDSSEG